MSAPDLPPVPEPKNLLLVTTARINRLQDQVLASLDVPLTSRQYRVLARVHQGFTSPTLLARLARRSLPTLSETIEGLVKRGLVERTPSATDRRAVILTLTPKGEKSLHVAEERMEELANELITALSPDAAEELAGHLEVLYKTAEGHLNTRAP